MKGRSYRFSSTEPHEDWLDGSWTVDCVCGVNFDDGEEMVDCDDCGVWVHTRCSRYVKGEDFTCAKCKSKNNVNDSEETEVAQLLIELPTKTLRMENSSTRSAPLKRPFRLWTEIPMEERVHVQGIPGGEPALFEGLSSVFSRELWKCTGYVPKKFNFKYREFPCWDEKEGDKTENTCENGHQEENGAGVLFSMSKKNVIDAPASVLVGTRNLDDKGTNDLKLGAKDTKSSDSGEAEMKHTQSAFKKDKSLLRPSITNKRRKELFGATKEAMKKKVEVNGQEEDNKKGSVGKTAFRPTSDCKPSESHKDIDPEGFTNNVGIIKSEKSKKPVLEESTDAGPALNNGNDESGNTAIGVECSREQNLSDVHANGAGKQEEKAGHHFRIVLRSSAISSDPSVLEEKDVPCTEANKEERQKTIADTPDDNAVDSPESLRKPCPGSTVGITREVEEKKCGIISSRYQKDVADASTGGAVGQQTLDSIDSKLAETSTSQILGDSEFNKMTQGGSRVIDHKLQPVELKQEPVISEKCILAQKDMLETKTGSSLPQDPPKSCRPVPRNVPGYDRPKVVVCIGKSSSNSATEKSSRSDSPKLSTSRNSIPGSKQQPSDGDANGEDRIAPSVSKTRESSNSGTFQKSGQSIFQSSKNPVQSILSLPPNSSTPLSDEELALRLHHQLNSSPRVPRVPRMRQPGSLPLSPTASSFKRSSSSGSKDHLTFSRRKNKHTSKESFRSSRDDDRCVRRTKTRHSPDWRTQESGSRGSVCTKGDDTETVKTSSSSRKVLLPPTSTTSTSSGPSSSNDLNEQNTSSPHSSARNTSDDTPVHRTLPGLINEIMSKGKRMTYEELCNAVLPHWPHLRKHNGERYAYSSHSQAVLDCLRNRHEWARLVDRGPKTNSGKKKRKVDADESDENESSKGRNNTSEGRGARKQLHHSQGEEFPKGKRKARKRRRLSLQGKGLKDFRKKINENISDDEEAEAEAEAEEEEGAFSDTSEESVFCEEEEEGGATAAREVEVSASSEEEEAEATS